MGGGHGVSGGVHVRSRLALGRGLVAGFDGAVQSFELGERGLVAAWDAQGESAQLRDANLESLNGAVQDGVAGAVEQGPIEIRLCLENRALIVLHPCRLAKGLEGERQAAPRGIVGAAAEQPRGEALELSADLVHVAGLTEAEDAHVRPATVTRLDQALRLELTQGLTHRRAARPRALCQLPLDEQLPGLEFEVGDGSTKGVRDLIADGGMPRDGHRCAVGQFHASQHTAPPLAPDR